MDMLAPGGFLSLSVQKGSGEGTETDPYSGDAQRFFARYTPDEMAELLTDAGFLILSQGENISGRH